MGFGVLLGPRLNGHVAYQEKDNQQPALALKSWWIFPGVCVFVRPPRRSPACTDSRAKRLPPTPRQVIFQEGAFWDPLLNDGGRRAKHFSEEARSSVEGKGRGVVRGKLRTSGMAHPTLLCFLSASLCGPCMRPWSAGLCFGCWGGDCSGEEAGPAVRPGNWRSSGLRKCRSPCRLVLC